MLMYLLYLVIGKINLDNSVYCYVWFLINDSEFCAIFIVVESK